MKSVKETVLRIENTLNTQNSNYVTRGEFMEFKNRWFLSHILAAIVPSLLTGLIVYFLTRH